MWFRASNHSALTTTPYEQHDTGDWREWPPHPPKTAWKLFLEQWKSQRHLPRRVLSATPRTVFTYHALWQVPRVLAECSIVKSHPVWWEEWSYSLVWMDKHATLWCYANDSKTWQCISPMFDVCERLVLLVWIREGKSSEWCILNICSASGPGQERTHSQGISYQWERISYYIF